MTKTILLVDDDEDYLTVAERAVQQDGLAATVIVARSGTEALERLGIQTMPSTQPRQEFAALFVDLNLPGVDGWEVLRRVRADTRLRRIPVVIVSSSARAEDVARCYDLGANSYVVKRFDASGPGRYLVRAMHYWLDLNRASRASSSGPS